MTETTTSFWGRNEFLLRRLHSLSGLIPVGAYMCIHLITNATILDSPQAFQDKVFTIHSLGKLLPVVEWGFIFLPLLFHAIFGFVIIRTGQTNSGTYSYSSNIRYTLQRVSGMIAFVFIMWHVFHMHGWIHAESWVQNVDKIGGAQFRPYNAASSAGAAIQASLIVQIAYAVGILACVYHLANGLWTMGITWGVWTSPAAQRRADWACLAFGIGLAFVGLSALVGMRDVNVEAAKQIEDRMYEARVAAGSLTPDEHKRSHETKEGTPQTASRETTANGEH